MSVVVDLERRTLTASIRDLTQSLWESRRGIGLLARARAELGTRVHQRYRLARTAVPGFLPEASLSYSTEVDGFAVTLRGRADGLIEGTGSTPACLEEVKSVSLGGPELLRMPAEVFPEFCLQLRFYALAYARTHPDRPVTARLILVSLVDDQQREIDLPPRAADTAARLIDLARGAIDAAVENAARRSRLRELAARLRFPYPALRAHQDELLSAMAEGLAAGRPVLAMAPTGIGKTVAALQEGLRHALTQDAQLCYLTAKTAQQQLVAETFEEICLRSELPAEALRCLTLRNKESMCPPGTMLCHPEACELLDDFDGRLVRSRALERLLASGRRIDPDAVFAIGETHRLCPFALSLALVPEVALIICDYNYVYDPAIALAELFGEDARAQVIVVDEAHNLFDRARGYYSPFIACAELAALAERLRRGEFLAGEPAERQLLLGAMLTRIDGPALFERMRALLERIGAWIDTTQAAAARSEAPALEDRRALEPDRAAWQPFATEAAELLLRYALYNRSHALHHPEDPLLDLLGRVVRVRDVLGFPGREIVPYSAGPNAPDGAGFGCLCVNPAARLHERHRTVRGTLAQSATLTPLSYYADVLGFQALNPLTLSVPSPFPREHLGVFVTPGVTTAYRERPRHTAGIARLIEQTCAARTGHYAAYFPSFQFLSEVQRELRLPAGQVLSQLPGQPEEQRHRLLARFRERRDAVLLLAVMGGVFAEGIDLPGQELIGAVVVGPGFPQVGFERATMQAYFEREYERGFAYAMVYPGMQRVIQAAGRVIRTPEDTGVVVLCDRRFTEPELSACFPPHWYRYDPSELVSEDLATGLKGFWRSLG